MIPVTQKAGKRVDYREYLTSMDIQRLVAGYWGQKVLMPSHSAKALVEINDYRMNKMQYGETEYLLALRPLNKPTDADVVTMADECINEKQPVNKIHRKLWDDVYCFEDRFSPTGYTYIKFYPNNIEVGKIDMDNPGKRVPYYSASTVKDLCLPMNCMRYLGYDVPIFVSPGHILNGKTLIQIGLAVDSTLITFR